MRVEKNHIPPLSIKRDVTHTHIFLRQYFNMSSVSYNTYYKRYANVLLLFILVCVRVCIRASYLSVFLCQTLLLVYTNFYNITLYHIMRVFNLHRVLHTVVTLKLWNVYHINRILLYGCKI